MIIPIRQVSWLMLTQLQWRDRDGITPSSLFSLSEHLIGSYVLYYNSKMKKIYTAFLCIFLLFILSCSEKINIYKDGQLTQTLTWDHPYDVSVKVKRNSVCWVEAIPENLDYFSGAIIADQTTAHIGKGEFINKLDYLNFTILLKKDYSLNPPANSKISINIDCNNGEYLFKNNYDIN